MDEIVASSTFAGALQVTHQREFFLCRGASSLCIIDRALLNFSPRGGDISNRIPCTVYLRNVLDGGSLDRRRVFVRNEVCQSTKGWSHIPRGRLARKWDKVNSQLLASYRVQCCPACRVITLLHSPTLLTVATLTSPLFESAKRTRLRSTTMYARFPSNIRSRIMFCSDARVSSFRVHVEILCVEKALDWEGLKCTFEHILYFIHW